jgi:hypothetical protein
MSKLTKADCCGCTQITISGCPSLFSTVACGLDTSTHGQLLTTVGKFTHKNLDSYFYIEIF